MNRELLYIMVDIHDGAYTDDVVLLFVMGNNLKP